MVICRDKIYLLKVAIVKCEENFKKLFLIIIKITITHVFKIDTRCIVIFIKKCLDRYL